MCGAGCADSGSRVPGVDGLCLFSTLVRDGLMERETFYLISKTKKF